MRLWVYKALCAVVIDKTYSNLYLKNHLNEVDKKDRALCTRIFYGTIQNYMYCEYFWKRYATRNVDQRIAVLLTMSVYQLEFLDKVPTYAVCNEAVDIAKNINPKLAGFVNAILRKVLNNDVEFPDDEIERLSVETSIKPWLLKLWKAQYGMERMVNMAYSSNQILPVYVRRNPLKISEEKFLEDVLFEKVDNMDLYIYKGDDFSNHAYYLDGCMSAQDEGSYLIAKAVDVCGGMSVLDTCAAPGTKSFAMAEMMENKGSITSLDIHKHRVQLITNDRNRLGLDIIHPLCKDATKLENLDLYDRVLCDVPCSGYGVLSRKPDIKLHMQPSDMDNLIPVQAKILEEASKHVKEDGLLVYSTCTINKKENDKQVENFLKNHTDYELVESKTLFPSKLKDGFYYAVLKKITV